MDVTRRAAVLAFAASPLFSQEQEPQGPGNRKPPFPHEGDEDPKLPNGKSQKDAIARELHEQALKDTDDLISLAQQLKDELQKSGDYIMPVSSVKKTEEIEKLAKKIRWRLKS